MTATSDTPPPADPAPPPADAPQSPRQLRRSDTNRVAAGVCGGLGEYFGVDPVLFRVLFATTAFFNGAGILGYLIAWAAIPQRGAAQAPIDRLVGAGRRRPSAPVWILAIVAALVIWGALFSWWAPRFVPWTFLPLVLAVVVLAVALSHRQAPGATPPAAPPPVDQAGLAPSTPWPPAPDPAFVAAREAARERRRRSVPVYWITLGVLALTLVVLRIVDATTGIAIPVYFWAIHIVVLAGLTIGAVLRRPIWWFALFLIPAAVGTFVFAGSRASLHDGSGDNTYTPISASGLHSDYRQAFGRLRLDLTKLPAPDAPRTVHIREAAGQVHLVLPASLPVNVHADVHLGQVEIDNSEDSSGMDVSTDPIATTSPDALTVDVDIDAGQLLIERV